MPESRAIPPLVPAAGSSSIGELSGRFLEERHRLFAYIYAMIRSRHVAEDLFQDVYLTLVRTSERGEAINDLPAWCRGVARNLALRYWHEQKQTPRHTTTDLLAGIELAFAENADSEHEALLQALAACRSSLPTTLTYLLDLKYVHDLSMRDIAARTRRSERAVITALARIRSRLMACIAGRLGATAHG